VLNSSGQAREEQQQQHVREKRILYIVREVRSQVNLAGEGFARARRVLMQSATIFDFATFRRTVGIPDTSLTFSAESDIPLDLLRMCDEIARIEDHAEADPRH
jgi:hypothetical protein